MTITIVADGREVILSGGDVVRDNRPDAKCGLMLLLMNAERELGEAFIRQCQEADSEAAAEELARQSSDTPPALSMAPF